MALSGDAKKAYQREYMRKRRVRPTTESVRPVVRPNPAKERTAMPEGLKPSEQLRWMREH